MMPYDASLDPTLSLPPDPLLPEPAVIKSISPETPAVATLHLELQDAARQAAYRCAPGQFNMLFVPGVGEVPISVSSGPGDQPGIGHTIRFVGAVTRAIEQLRAGQILGLRGPYGRPWPLAGARGKDVLVVAGGLGLAPVRPVITTLLAERTRYGRLMLVYGARQPVDLLFNSQYREWRQQGLELQVTVDRADEGWGGRVGVVPVLLGRLSFDSASVAAFVCGPEIMMRFTVYELLARGVPPAQIFLSIERNMQCAVGVCGRCQLGPYFVCRDGPVFSYAQICRFLKQEHF